MHFPPDKKSSHTKNATKVKKKKNITKSNIWQDSNYAKANLMQIFMIFIITVFSQLQIMLVITPAYTGNITFRNLNQEILFHDRRIKR